MYGKQEICGKVTQHLRGKQATEGQQEGLHLESTMSFSGRGFKVKPLTWRYLCAIQFSSVVWA